MAQWGQVPKVERIINGVKRITGSLKPNPLYNVSRKHRSFILVLTVQCKFTLEAIQKRLKSPQDTKDMLDSFLDLHANAPDRLSIREVIGAIYINV